MNRWVPAAVVAILVAGWPCGVAAAITPPPVDDTFLPPAARPMPPQPTQRDDACETATLDPGRGHVTNQLSALGLQTVWSLGRGRGQTVAVIDTGVSRHQRLAHLQPGGDYVSGGDGTEDCDAHGTIVAGIIAGMPDETFSGVAPDVSLITIRQSSNIYSPADHSQRGFGTVDTLAMAVRTAADLGATVINISTVACAQASTGLDDRALGAALAYAVDVKDAVVVAAAGNVEPSGPCAQPVAVSPGWYDDYVLTVGSTARDGTPSSFSLGGHWVDVAAPGEDVASLSPSGDGLVNRYGASTPISGTSFAAPVVSGLAALVRARFPQLRARDVMRRIESSAHHPADGRNPVVGNGMVDVVAALSDRGAAIPDSPQPRRPASQTAALAGAAVCVVILGVTALGRRRSHHREDDAGRDGERSQYAAGRERQ
jgi:membrane-anchored mycosin MYCP